MSMFSAIHKLLPVPDYLRLPSIGVDISDSSLKYVQFTPNYNDNTLTLAQWGDIDVPDGTLSQGEILDPKQLTTALAAVKEKTGGEYVRISLPEERAYIFETTIKRGTSFKEIRGVLEFRLEENVPLSPRDAFFDYEILPSSIADEALRVSVTVYARETINRYYEAAREAGLIPLSFEVEAAAVARAALPLQEQGTHLIIDFGKTRTGVGIMHQGTLMYTSTIDIGGEELSTALRSVLGETAESELTNLKNTVGLTHSVEYPAVAPAIESAVEKIITELKLRMQYWESHALSLPNHEIRSIVLCGGSSNLKGLPNYLENTLNISTVRAQVWRNAFSLEHNIPPIDRRHSYGYATAIGLALAGHIAFYD